MTDDRGSWFLGIIAPPRRGALALALALAFCSQLALAAGPFDGQWKGNSPPNGKSCKSIDINVTIANGLASGQAVTSVGNFAVTGTARPDGSFSGTLGTSAFTGTFAGDHFDGSFHTPYPSCPVRTVSLDRAK
jgi:hypothetical protein